MKSLATYLFLFVLIALTQTLGAQEKNFLIKGQIVSANDQKPVEGVVLRLSNSIYSAVSDKKGFFQFSVPKKPVLRLICSHLSYEVFTKEIRSGEKDSAFVTIALSIKTTPLEMVSVVATHKPETLIGKPNYSIFDFDFYEDKLILLTAEQSLKNAQIQLADYGGKIFSKYQLPKDGGEALNFFHDFEGYTEVICKDTIFRLEVLNTELLMMTIRKADYEKYLKNISDTANGSYYFSNYWEKYPSFNYYATKPNDSLAKLLKTISNNDLMSLYNFEYYNLPSRMQLEARRMADYYKTDVHIIAALMSGFTNSMFYEPLYAPLFVINDTICIFNHHNNQLYHYNKENTLIDSVKIMYHHPKNWRDWKRKLFVDETQNKVYAYFSKDGHHYLKQINYQSGKEVLTYKLQHHSAEKIKIKDGYVYYVYRPFGSTQERFLYRERIE
ncbi:MAG: carboxypeptidase-like regulatory domain-containing protein [Bacteroidia bacterium]|nr:carboxypeptidase-like regulatory domain-containing protein [Bacteroidia bacterium]